MRYEKVIKELPKLDESTVKLYDELEELQNQMNKKANQIRQVWLKCEHNVNQNFWYITSHSYDRNENSGGGPLAMRTQWKRVCLKCGKVETTERSDNNPPKDTEWSGY